MGLLLEGKKALENELVDRKGVFSNAKVLDRANEAMPSNPENLSNPNTSNLGPGSTKLVPWWGLSKHFRYICVFPLDNVIFHSLLYNDFKTQAFL